MNLGKYYIELSTTPNLVLSMLKKLFKPAIILPTQFKQTQVFTQAQEVTGHTYTTSVSYRALRMLVIAIYTHIFLVFTKIYTFNIPIRGS